MGGRKKLAVIDLGSIIDRGNFKGVIRGKGDSFKLIVNGTGVIDISKSVGIVSAIPVINTTDSSSHIKSISANREGLFDWLKKVNACASATSQHQSAS